MRSLKSLTKFIVGGGCKIGDLKNLNLHQRELEIQRLERVTNKDEAMEAELKNDEYLRDLELSFEWNDSFGTSEVERIEGVLEGLEPHGNLNELTIKSYIGSKFPRWMMSGTVLSNLLVLVVNQCNCVQLPFLESLEKLFIDNMPKMKRIGSEFFGIYSSDGVDRSFPKLKKLWFIDLNEWEVWEMTTRNEITIMPSLVDLEFYDCPKLKSLPECIMSSSTIRELTIINCPKLWTLEKLPASSTLKILTIGCKDCVTLPQGLAQLKSLERLIIRNSEKVECIPQELRHLTSLQELAINNCDILGPRCQREGEDWKIISHIPNIKINYRKIQ
ncbi:hypothetical protein GIB67_014327 [Kingdonia uniflora]|uniref:R13L1/DRL21-like LRR repeat region domain-containing protein n=1 Tax=Kingdonia uniflora TaxID=39325 RepID=A0A7J7NT71_9MAGN|nr:hypothetical protein GIB67_014327 [Kingdonia uniflora]